MDVSWQTQLFERQDLDYRRFQCRLMPTVDPDTVIGVRTPQLRQLAKQWAKTPQAARFLQQLPHEYYEENNLHGMLLSRLGDFDETVAALDAFLPHVDNWATCDLISPTVFRRCRARLLEPVRRWMAHEWEYTVRFGIRMLMCHYLEEEFQPTYLQWVADIKRDEYYVNMMRAWFFATALAKQYDATLAFFQQRRLDVWTHNKALQKARESYRVTPEQKIQLQQLKLSPEP